MYTTFKSASLIKSFNTLSEQNDQSHPEQTTWNNLHHNYCNKRQAHQLAALIAVSAYPRMPQVMKNY